MWSGISLRCRWRSGGRSWSRLPWVAHATVMRLLPNRMRVSIVERTPVAFVRQGNHIGLVDANGVLLDMPTDAQAGYALFVSGGDGDCGG